ncbi:MAG: type II secretion system F family protein [Candidatus Heimdallarchaeota archaeon]
MVEIPKPGKIKNLILSGDFTRLIVYICTGVSVSLFLILALLSFFELIGFGSTSDYLIFAVLSGTGIYGIFEYLHFKRIHKIDSIFPDFIRDIAASRRAGMTFTKSILFTSKGNYGLLTSEIKKIAQQISWGSSVEDALKAFSHRINTNSVRRTVSLIIEASKSGGNVADVLDVAAVDAREIKILEGERRVTMATYVIVIYVCMFVFLAIISILVGTFIPAILGEGSAGLSSTMGGLGGGIGQADIIQVFYAAILIQSIGTGVVAGIFEDGHLQSSVKHVFIMVLASWFVFKFFIGV